MSRLGAVEGRNMMADAGYNSAGEEDAVEVVFSFELQENQWSSSGVSARLLRNDRPCGLFYLKSKEEFEWLRNRVAGVYTSEGGG
jgi:hypothetical protein